MHGRNIHTHLSLPGMQKRTSWSELLRRAVKAGCHGEELYYLGLMRKEAEEDGIFLHLGRFDEYCPILLWCLEEATTVGVKSLAASLLELCMTRAASLCSRDPRALQMCSACNGPRATPVWFASISKCSTRVWRGVGEKGLSPHAARGVYAGNCSSLDSRRGTFSSFDLYCNPASGHAAGLDPSVGCIWQGPRNGGCAGGCAAERALVLDGCQSVHL
jgi:hypothetical protein